MKAFKHLLAATDFSSSSLHAVDRGFLLAGKSGARYTVVHALGLDALEQFRGLLGVELSGLSRKITDDMHDALAQIVYLGEDLDCDLVVMGKHGANVTEELLLGSVTSHVLAESRSDVLVTVDMRAPMDASAAAGVPG